MMPPGIKVLMQPQSFFVPKRFSHPVFLSLLAHHLSSLSLSLVHNVCSAWDSGDPVVWTSSSNTGDQDILVGLGSWGEECADPNFPGVQTRISWAADWIDTHVCQLSRDPPADFNCHGLGKSPLSPAPVNGDHHVVPMVGTCLLLVVGCLMCFQKVKKQQQYPLQEEQFVSLKSTYGATGQA